MTSPFHSIRWRVQTWHAIILFAVIAAFCFTAWRLAWDTTLRRIDGKLHEAERYFVHGFMHAVVFEPGADTDTRKRASSAEIIARVNDQNTPPKFSADFLQRFADTTPGFAYYRVFTPDGQVLLESPNAPAGFQAPPTVDEKSPPREWILTIGNRRESQRSSPARLATSIGIDITPERAEMRRLAWSLAGAGFAVWLLGLLGGWWISGRVISPIRAISRTATRIANGNLDERIDTRDTESELGQLARILNETFARLHASIEQQKRFTADASHELRTPISILIAETQRILKRDRTSDEYRDSLQVCNETATRMRHLVEALLILARQENTNTAQTHTDCDLAEILRAAARQLVPLAAQNHLAIDTDALRAAPCRGDAAALGIVATNLLSNAIQHHTATAENPGCIRLETGTENNSAYFLVADDGPGIPPDDLPHIFERFYRADKSRTRSTEQTHTGLGLAIARQIVENHAGTIEARNNPPRGALLKVTIPAK